MKKLKVKSYSVEEPQNSTIASISDYLKTVIEGDATIGNKDVSIMDYYDD